ncbi:MAG: hypothetical protein JWM91_3330, partial [Rhodospirillales bacterium]|nr:hypothetical protein [Rhodospirillales bacterium]
MPLAIGGEDNGTGFIQPGKRPAYAVAGGYLATHAISMIHPF